MPAGDAQRTWFPEIVERLRAGWSPALSLIELVALRDELDSLLQAIRSERGILPPLMWCRHCQARTRGVPPRVSVRAAILALGRFGMAGEDEVKALDKAWQKHRKAHQLDLYGSVVHQAPKAKAHAHEA